MDGMEYENSPMVFQRVMKKVLGGLIGKGVEIYLNDIVVHAKMKGEHDALMEKAFLGLDRKNMKVNKKEIQFSQRGGTIKSKSEWKRKAI
jgi:hypothetical protein